jgi:hypothetical protein
MQEDFCWAEEAMHSEIFDCSEFPTILSWTGNACAKLLWVRASGSSRHSTINTQSAFARL